MYSDYTFVHTEEQDNTHHILTILQVHVFICCWRMIVHASNLSTWEEIWVDMLQV